MFPVLFIIPIFGFLVEKNIKFPPLEVVGKASYNIFLTQMLYFWKVYDKVKDIVENTCANAFISIIICVAVGILFYELEYRVTKKVTGKILEKVR